MAGKAPDETAIEYASDFCQALSYGKDVRSAYELEANRLRLLAYEDKAQPQLLSSLNVAGEICIV